MSLVKVNAPDTTFEEGGQEIVLAYNMETGKYEWAKEVQVRPHSFLPILAIIIIVMTLVILYAMR